MPSSTTGLQSCLLAVLCGLSPVFTAISALASPAFQGSPTNLVPRKVWNDDVTYDNYSLILKGKRVFLHSGEFHTFRLPVPDLWPDILEKTRAAGLNGISIYSHMGLLNPSRGVVDFDEWRALKPFFELAIKYGIWIVLRPGPYINSETSAGGIAHWVTAEVEGLLRTGAEDWREAWLPYMQRIVEEVAPYQITNGGPIVGIQIDNEYQQALGAEYYQDLIDFYRDSGVDVLLTYNDLGPGRNFINGTGAVDLYGMDWYPQGWDCSTPEDWYPLDLWYHDYHQEANSWQPFYSPEFQGGSLDSWGPNSTGYGKCAIFTNSAFENVFYQHLWASNMKLVSYYMFYGGTSWGAIPHPVQYTSYDWGAAIAENRVLREKYYELKNQGLFLRSSPDFYKTKWIGNSTLNPVFAVSDERVVATLLRNLDSGIEYYIMRQNNSASWDIVDITLNTTRGKSIPVTIGGRQSKLVVTNYAFGSSSMVDHSTAQILFAGIIEGRDVLLLYGRTEQSHEAAIQLTGQSDSNPSSELVSIFSDGLVLVEPGVERLVTVYLSSTQLVLFADEDTARAFWAPMVSSDLSDDFANFWDIAEDDAKQVVLVGGPYLVRDAKWADGGRTLALRGDLNESTTITIIGVPKRVERVTWNGAKLSLQTVSEVDGHFTVPVNPSISADQITLPTLGEWRVADSLPEIQDSYDDSLWTLANRTETTAPKKMYFGDGRVLYGCDYKFCESIVLWRGHFNAIGDEESVDLSVNGGQAFAATVWLNDVFLGTAYGNSSHSNNVIEEVNGTYAFPKGSLRPGEDNVITVVQDNMGKDMTIWTTDVPLNPELTKSPRGIRGFRLDGGNGTQFGEWKVQGKVGGYTDYSDKHRGVYNEGGLFGERAGWHLPGFDASSWNTASDLSVADAGVKFFVAKFDLDFPTPGNDLMLSFNFEESNDQPYRTYVWINGWMMGKRIGNLGPQYKFPVHEGILDYHGSNTVAVAVWNLEEGVTVTPTFELKVDAMFDGGVEGAIAVKNPGWSPEGREWS